MRKMLIGFAMLVCFTAALLAQDAPDILWYKTFGGPNRDAFYEVVLSDDGDYVLTGLTASFSTCGTEDIWLVKTTPDGSMQWDQSLSLFCTNSYEEGQSLIQTSDGGYAIGGISNRSNQLSTQAFLYKTNGDGDSLWVREYGDYYWNEGSYTSGCLKQTADGGYIIAAFTAGYCPTGDHGLYMIKTDSMGNTDWANCYGSSGWDGAEEVLIDEFGDYWITGYTTSLGTHGSADACLFRFDQSGGLAEQHTYGGSAYDRGKCLRRMYDGFVLAGETSSFGAGEEDFYLVRTDLSGAELWHRTYGGSSEDYCYALERISDGGFILVGTTQSFGAGNKDAYIIRTDATGETLWTKTLGGSGNDWATDVKITPEGDYLVCGWTESSGAGNFDGFLTKIASDIENAGFVDLVSPGPPDWTYSLNWVSGAITSFTFTDFCPGTIGSTGGDAASAGWTATNYADSIVFSSTTPLTSGSIEAFTLSHPWCSDAVSWQVGDSSGSVDGPLPVELLSFEATSIGDAVRISFSTASETDNDYFEIWRSESDMYTFERIATLPAQGNTASGHSYQYVDKAISAGQSYWYYLVDVDINGIRSEHRELMVSASVPVSIVPTEYSLTAYPNPFNPITMLEYTLPEAGDVNLNVYDISGRIISALVSNHQGVGTHEVTFDASSLPSGIYMARLETDEISVTRKLLLVK